MKVGDIVRSIYDIRSSDEYEIINKNSYYYGIRCVKSNKSNELMKELAVSNSSMSTDFEVIRSAQKPIDKAFDKLTKTYKIDYKGDNIHIDEWNRLYCSCDNRKSKTVRVLHIDHKICTNCKKEII